MQVVPSDHFHLLKFEARKKDLSHVAGKEKKNEGTSFLYVQIHNSHKDTFFPPRKNKFI